MSERDDFGAFMIGFVVGTLTGAVVSLLFAPQSGEETRVLIKERAIELGDRVNETATKVGSEVEQRSVEYRQKAGDLADKARTNVNELSKKGAAVLEEQKAKVTEAVQSISQPKDETAV
jgi:gas vesicle protein